MTDPIHATPRPALSADPSDYTGPSILSIVGVLVILVGLGGLIFALRFDTTAALGGDTTELLNDRLVYAIAAGFTMLFGVGLAGLGRRGPPP